MPCPLLLADEESQRDSHTRPGPRGSGCVPGARLCVPAGQLVPAPSLPCLRRPRGEPHRYRPHALHVLNVEGHQPWRPALVSRVAWMPGLVAFFSPAGSFPGWAVGAGGAGCAPELISVVETQRGQRPCHPTAPPVRAGQRQGLDVWRHVHCCRLCQVTAQPIAL